jgi:hypothetical protein
MHFSILRAVVIAAGSFLIAPAALAQVSAPVPLPEPASWAIMGVGLIGLFVAVRRNRRK